MILDPRLHAYRPDLADEALIGCVDALSFVKPKMAWVSAPIASIYKYSKPNLARDTEALYGSPLKVFEHGKTFSWIQLLGDNYVGYIETSNLSFTPRPKPNYHISTTCSHIYSAPNLKSHTLKALPFRALLSIKGEVDGHYALIEGGFVNKCHCDEIYETVIGKEQNSGSSQLIAKLRDLVTVTAISFLNTPYLWGGKSYSGIDCSGLVQLSYATIGMNLPRDSDMQMEFMDSVAKTNNKITLTATHVKSHNLNSSDLIFWKGHVAIALDSKTIIHANAHHMKVVIEPIEESIARISAKGDEVLCVKRLIL